MGKESKLLQEVIDNVQDLKVLVVDDQVNMRRTIKNMLRTMGFRNFTEAEDGAVALRIVERESFDLIICDWNMPRVTGVEVLRSIRNNKKFNDISFLMLTGEVEESRVAETIEAEVDDYLLKPFEIRLLTEKLIKILSKRRMPSMLDVQVKKAEQLIEARNFAQAHKELDSAARVHSRSPKLFFQRGLIFEAEGKPPEAEKCFHVAKQLGPLFIKVHDKLAHVYQARGRHGDVCAILEEALKISPNNVHRQMRLGRAYLAEKRYPEAKKAFKKVLELDRDNPDRFLAVAKIFISHNFLEDAEETYRKLIEIDPKNVEAYNALGIFLRRVGRYPEALQCYRQALLAAPYEPKLYFNLARALIETNQTDEAAVLLRRALEVDPRFEQASHLLKQIGGAGRTKAGQA